MPVPLSDTSDTWHTQTCTKQEPRMHTMVIKRLAAGLAVTFGRCWAAHLAWDLGLGSS
jgi:ubiquitin C-terminal hydrolase